MHHNLYFANQVGIYQPICSKQTWEVRRAMIIIPNSQIREMKAKGAYFSKAAHLIIDRPSETLSCHTCCFFYELTDFLSHTGPKSLFLSSHLFHSHKTMQFSLICARIPQKLQQRIVQGLIGTSSGNGTLTLDFSLYTWKCTCTYHMPEISLYSGETLMNKSWWPSSDRFYILRGHNHVCPASRPLWGFIPITVPDRTPFPVPSVSLCGESSWLKSTSKDEAKTKIWHSREALTGRLKDARSPT